MTPRRAALVILLVAAVATVVGIVRRSPSVPVAIDDHRSRPSRSPAVALPTPAPMPTGSSDDDAAWQARRAAATRAREAWERYPPWSRPARDHADLFGPHIAPTLRRLVPGEPSSARIQIDQDRVFALPGELVAIDVAASPAAVVRDVQLRDEPATAAVIDGAHVQLAPCDNRAEGVRVQLDVSVGLEAGVVDVIVICTGPSPARFTEHGGAAVRSGSVIFDVELDVTTPGPYEVTGRLYDATDRPIALLTYRGELPSGISSVTLQAFGALLVDERALGPLALRQLEAARLLDGEFPDRQIIPPWPAGYRTTGDLSGLDPTPWR